MMERIVIENLSKQFRMGFKGKQSALARLLEISFGRGSTKMITAVDNISFTVNAGEIVGIIGKNASGKSTLLRLIAGVYKSDKGNKKTNGKIVSMINLRSGLRTKSTMRENIYLVGSLFGLGQKEIKNKFNEIVEFAELSEYIDTKINQFSSGMTQRLAFSIAIHANPEILLLDEVLTVGDYGFREKCIEKIRELVKSGGSVLLASHGLYLIKKFCDEIIWMENGKIIAKGKPEEIISLYKKSFQNEN